MSEKIAKYGNKSIRQCFNSVRDSVHQNAIDHGWHDKPREIGTTLMLCVCELTEAMEEHRDHRDTDEIYYKGDKPEGIPIEIADCIIRLLDFCGKENIDIGKAINIKHSFNINRPYMHGNKAC